MKKSLIVSLLILSVIGFGVGIFFSNVYDCGYSVDCYNLFSRVGNPLFYGMGALALVFLILLFTPQAVSAWKKFAAWFVPFAVLLFIFYPDPGSGDLFSPYPEQVFRWTSILYIIVSLIIILYKRAKTGKSSEV